MVVSNALIVVEVFLIFYIAYYSLSSLKQIQRLFDIIIGVSAIVAILGIAQYLAGGIPPVVGFLFDPEYHFYGRVTSIFSNPNTLGEFLGSIVGMTIISFGWSTASKKKKYLF